MAFKSVAERERLRKLVEQGTYPKADFEQHEKESSGRDLPDRLTPEGGRRRLSTGGSQRYSRAGKARLY